MSEERAQWVEDRVLWLLAHVEVPDQACAAEAVRLARRPLPLAEAKLVLARVVAERRAAQPRELTEAQLAVLHGAMRERALSEAERRRVAMMSFAGMPVRSIVDRIRRMGTKTCSPTSPSAA